MRGKAGGATLESGGSEGCPKEETSCFTKSLTIYGCSQFLPSSCDRLPSFPLPHPALYGPDTLRFCVEPQRCDLTFLPFSPLQTDTQIVLSYPCFLAASRQPVSPTSKRFVRLNPFPPRYGHHIRIDFLCGDPSWAQAEHCDEALAYLSAGTEFPTRTFAE